MASLALQRCVHHLDREAIARCVECSRFFCRECIAEHDDRLICAACLAKHGRAEKKEKRRGLSVRPALGAFAGVLLAWFSFHSLGGMLLSIPAKFHSKGVLGSLWQAATQKPLDGDDEEGAK